MIKKDINQNDILNSELLNIIDYNYIFDEKPIKRIKTKPTLENSKSRLEALKNKIEAIESCDLKKNASKIVFADGNIQSSIMIIGEGPGQKEDELGKPFVGDAGNLLNKMLKAIKIEREKVYITNVVNYRPPNNRKPETSEINRYSKFLKEHITSISKGKEENYKLGLRVLDFEVELGKIENLEQKIKNFKAFYKKAMKDKKLNAYRRVSLQFDNQVVCTKK